MCDYVCNSIDAYSFFLNLTLVLHVYIIHYVLILLQDGILLFFVPSIKCMAYNVFHYSTCNHRNHICAIHDVLDFVFLVNAL